MNPLMNVAFFHKLHRARIIIITKLHRRDCAKFLFVLHYVRTNDEIVLLQTREPDT